MDPRWMREHRPALAACLALLLLVGWATVARYGFLSSSPYPLGIDGYYYPIQLRSLLDNGHLYYPSAPLGLWLMAPFAALTDPIAGAKIATALAGALIAVPMYILGSRISGDRAAGLLAAVLATSSASAFYLTSEFAKNCIGLTMAMGYLCVLGWGLDKLTRRRLVVVAGTFVAVVLTHKMAAALAVVGSLPPLWVYVRQRRQPSATGGKQWRMAALLAGGVALPLLALALLDPERFLGAADASKLGALFQGKASWGLPVLDTGRGDALLFGREVLIGAGFSIAALACVWLATSAWLRTSEHPIATRLHARLVHVPARDRAFLVGLALFGIFLAIPWLDVSDGNKIGFRLRLVAFIPLGLGAAAVAGAATAWLAPLTRGALLVGIAVGWLTTRPMQATEEGVVRAHPAMISAVAAMNDVVPKGDVVIVPERQVMFMIAWYTGTNARLSVSAVPPEKRWRLITYFYGGPALRRALSRVPHDAPPEIVRPRGLHPFGADGLVLVPEATWQWTLNTLSAKDRQRYDAWD